MATITLHSCLFHWGAASPSLESALKDAAGGEKAENFRSWDEPKRGVTACHATRSPQKRIKEFEPRPDALLQVGCPPPRLWRRFPGRPTVVGNRRDAASKRTS